MIPIEPGDRFALPSGKVVHIDTVSKAGEVFSGRFLFLGAIDLRSNAVVGFSRDFLERFGKRMSQPSKGKA